MRVVYLDHSGFYLETAERAYLIDYFRGELPDIPADKPLLVLVSHAHADHFTPAIFERFAARPRTVFVLSDDVPAPELHEVCRIHGTCDAHEVCSPVHEACDAHEVCSVHETCSSVHEVCDVHGTCSDTHEACSSVHKVCDAHEACSSLHEVCRVIRVGAHETCTVAGARIETLRSTDQGVAFCVTDGGQTFLHLGDLNWWDWGEEDTPAEKANMQRDFCHEIGLLRARRIDLAFVPLDPRLGARFYRGADYLMRTADVRALVPMHTWGDETMGRRLAQHPCSASWRSRILVRPKAGESLWL